MLLSAEKKEMKKMWGDLADGLIQQTTIDVTKAVTANINAKYLQAFTAFLQGGTLTGEKLLEEFEKVGIDAEVIAGIKNSLQSA